MIIRKPFAFIVQKFKLLHFIILMPMLYLVYKYFNLSQFFNKFVVNGYVTTITNAPDIYYSFLMIIGCIVVITFMILLTALFKKKNKNYYPYLLLTLVYITVFVFSIFSKGLLVNAVNATLESSTSLIIRSITSILFYVQIACIPVVLLLTFGFDFRSGDFLDIKDEISLDEEDSEEVEVNLTNDNYKLKRWFNRYLREIKYYVIENKNVFKVLGGILGVIILFFVGKYIISLSRVVRVDQAFNYSNMSLSFNGSLLSNMDYSGNVIMDGKVYLAVKVTAKNNTRGLLAIETSDFCLEINKNCYYPTLDRSGKFLDIAVPYYGEQIGMGKSNEYVFVYELDEKLAKSKYKIKILDSLTYKENEVIAKYKEINLTPSFSSSVTNIKTYNVGEEINFTKSNVLDTKLTVKEYKIDNVYRYSYDYCYKGECSKSMNNVSISSNSTLLILNADYSIDENASYFKNSKSKNSFFNDFAKIKYTINGNEYYADVINKTPKEVTDQIVLETTNNITKADNIQLIFTIRDRRYTLNLE